MATKEDIQAFLEGLALRNLIVPCFSAFPFLNGHVLFRVLDDKLRFWIVEQGRQSGFRIELGAEGFIPEEVWRRGWIDVVGFVRQAHEKKVAERIEDHERNRLSRES